MNATTPHNRPAPHLISFAPECFETIGTKIVYVVVLSAPSYPVKFDSRAAAEEFAHKRGRTVTESVETIRRRVRWN